MNNKKRLFIIVIPIFVIATIFLIMIQNHYFLNNDLSILPSGNVKDQRESVNIDSSNLKCDNCNLLIISLTNVSASHLGSYGYFRNGISPNIDKFNKDAMVFKNAFTVSSWTPPAAASLFTSLYPYTHNLMRWYTDVSPLDSNMPTIASILKENGFVTASFNGGADYDVAYGLNNGFDTYHQGEAFSGIKDAAPVALDWLRENRDKKFFLHLQGFDVHCPYYPPEIKYGADYEGRSNVDFSRCFYNATEQEAKIINGEKYYSVFSSLPPRLKQSSDSGSSMPAEVLLSEKDIDHVNDLYDSDIYYTDKLLGNFLDEFKKMGLYDDTIIVFTSEHGEMIFKNGRMMRGGIMRGNFYEDVAHIPLSVRFPLREGGEYEDLVGIVDVVPTILDFLGINGDNYFFQGKSLMPLLEDSATVNDYVFGGTEFYADDYNKSNSKFFFGSVRSNSGMIRSKEWKLIKESLLNDGTETVKYELYDLKNDPDEEVDLITTNNQIEKILKIILEEWENAVSASKEKESHRINEDLLKEMKARGY